MLETIQKLLTPETAGLLLTIIVLLLAKSKLITERDISRAKEMLEIGKNAAQAAQETRLKAAEIEREAAIAETPADTNRKKIQRAARALLRGWLR